MIYSNYTLERVCDPSLPNWEVTPRPAGQRLPHHFGHQQTVLTLTHSKVWCTRVKAFSSNLITTGSGVNLKLLNVHPNRLRFLLSHQWPSSTRFCRPIKFDYKKESAELTRTEVALIQDQIDELNPTSISMNNQIKIHHELLFTMIDGKVCGSVSETASQTCHICKATPKSMNDLKAQKTQTLTCTNLVFPFCILGCGFLIA